MGCGKFVSSAVSFLFEYDTPKIVHINSKKVGVVNRLIQLAVIGYIIGWVIIINRGYQASDTPISSTTTKLKGVVYTNTSNMQRIWDVADYVVPPQENEAFFVTTDAIITNNQSQTTCPEDYTMIGVLCDPENPHDVCQPNTAVTNGNGVKTGNCVKSDVNETVYVCEIHAWCPVEVDKPPGRKPLLNVSDFTVLIKNNVEFASFNVKRRNIINDTKDWLKKCHYDPNDELHKYCPIFRLGDIVRLAGDDITEMSLKGGVVAIIIRWDCDLDHGEDECLPKYEFRRIDKKDTKFAGGWNFRYANYYFEDGIAKRSLVKAYGIRFIILVKGTAWKFSFIPLILKIGSGLALLSVATIMCDIFVLYCLKKRNYYREKKYQYVKGDDAYQVLDEEPIRDNSVS
ncbi:P2X purinoceptor 4-like isoform X2 [Tubulanus polymorphus]|uniref:P2X purinoceptor 4-like isoform X2 n=1 Tax=Tubulanus polymorphus TaxID=672921 RepID=UPI003DA5C3F0